MESKKYLILGSETMKHMVRKPILFFLQMTELLTYIYGNVASTDEFTLVIPSEDLELLFEDQVYNSILLKQIFVYYDDYANLQQDEVRLQQNHPKLRFRHRRILQKLIAIFEDKINADQSASNHQPMIGSNNLIFTSESRISQKQARTNGCASSASKRIDQVRNRKNFVGKLIIVIISYK